MPASRKRRMVAEEAEEEATSEEEVSHSTQRRRQRMPVDDDSDNDAVENSGPIAREEMEIDESEKESKDQLVKKLVRYALACEYQRLPIRREGIRDKVFGKHKTPFKAVFEAAQTQLRTKLGMEMVELPLKEKVTLKERRAAPKPSQALALSNSYILTSTLPAVYRIPTILPPSIAPTTSTEAAYTALYTMVVTLITLCGGTLADAKLERYLRRMNADVNMPMDKTEATLQKMIKQGYLIRVKENVGGEETIDWMVGPRGKLEVGNKGVKGLIMDVYGDSAPEDLADRVNSSLGLDVPREEQEEHPTDARAAETAPRGRGRPLGRRRQADDGRED